MTEPELTLPETQGPIIKRRNSFVVGFLSFLMSGLGHLYIGEARRGVFFFFGETFLTIIFFASPITFSVRGLFSFLAALIAYKIFAVGDSVIINRKKGAFELKRYNRPFAYLGIVIFATILSTIIETSTARIETFKIPSPSMVPTFLVGDHIIVDRWVYRKQSPARGDLIVFRFPKNKDLDFIKRSVAVAGDLLEIRDKVLFIDGIRVEEPYAALFDTGSLINRRDNFGPYIVPADKVFTLGDNRDNSNDSRFWGPVDIEDVKGKVRVIYWSWDSNSRAVRWDRIGMQWD